MYFLKLLWAAQGDPSSSSSSSFGQYHRCSSSSQSSSRCRIRHHRLCCCPSRRPPSLSSLFYVVSLLLLLLMCPCTVVHSADSSTVTLTPTPTISDCESRTLDIPPPPNFSMDDLAQSTSRQMAHQLGTFISSLSAEQVRNQHPEIKAKTIEIAQTALEGDTRVLAAGVVTAFIPFAIVQFPSSVMRASGHWEESKKKREFLSAYWRIMGGAWNRTGNTEQWGFPFRDCGPLRQRWLWPYTATIHVARYKIVTALFVPADTDPCVQSERLAKEIYGRSAAENLCNNLSETCTPVRAGDAPPEEFPARTDLFSCECRPGFIRESMMSESISDNNTNVTNYFTTTTTTDTSPTTGECIPCHLATRESQSRFAYICNNSAQNAILAGGAFNANLESLLSEMEQVATLSLESLMNATIGAILGSCIVTSMGLALIVYRKRKFKTIASSMWTILEMIILGIVVMYAAVLVHFLEASNFRCLLEPWLRELGFVICYGAITLKLYLHLIEFRTRKAHRCVVRHVDLLKYLGAMVLAVLCYLSAFTASSMDFVEHSHLEGLKVENNLCRPLKWDYVTEAGEMAILLFGLYLSYISRNAKTIFQERNFLVAAIIIEFVVSINFYIFRAIYVDQLNAQVLFLCLFVRSQLTNTVTLGLVFLPKLLNPQKKGLNESAFRSGTSAGPNLSAGDPDIGEVTLSEMNPEEIRKELKRLYTQLEILKNKTLRLDNPHISKRRGGRKTHRRFSLQKKGSKDKALHAKNRANAHHDAEITEAEPSRTPEDSVCSVEGPTEMVITK